MDEDNKICIFLESLKETEIDPDMIGIFKENINTKGFNYDKFIEEIINDKD